jgi:hypothetical protein
VWPDCSKGVAGLLHLDAKAEAFLLKATLLAFSAAYQGQNIEQKKGLTPM